MNKLMNILLLVAPLALTGCALPAAKDEGQLAPLTAKDQHKATYAEKTSLIAPSQLPFLTTCPREGAWTGVEWRQAVGMANGCVKAKDWRRVESIGRHLGMRAPLTPWGPYYMSLAAGARKDYPRAVWMLELALKKAPSEGLFHYQLGRMHWEMGEDQVALKELKIASDMNPALADAHWVMGQMALQRGDLSDAERLLNKALTADPHHFPALMAMGALKAKGKDWQAAEMYLTRAVSASSRDGQARQALLRVQEILSKNARTAKTETKERKAE